jgi:UPF0755 protein
VADDDARRQASGPSAGDATAGDAMAGVDVAAAPGVAGAAGVGSEVIATAVAVPGAFGGRARAIAAAATGNGPDGAGSDDSTFEVSAGPGAAAMPATVAGSETAAAGPPAAPGPDPMAPSQAASPVTAASGDGDATAAAPVTGWWPRRWQPRVLAAAATVAALCLAPAFWATARVGDSPLAGGTLLIEPGTSAAGIASRLRERQAVTAPLSLLRLYMRLRGDAGRLQAGEFRAVGGETLASFLDRIVAGDVVRYQVTLVEGMRIDAVLERLAAQPALRRTLSGSDGLLAAIGAGDGPAEGRFLPDTYSYVRGDSDAQVLRQAHRRMQEVLAQEWAGRAPGLPYRSMDEALVAASLVEKETGRPEDRALIAGVFVERLRRGMLLQSDPTVIYALGAAFDGNLRRDDLQRDLAFNTYVRPGLPPAPIALPGRDAIHAALHPREEGYLYFVARGDGSSAFSRTLDEHNAAVDRYQRQAAGR